MRRERSKVRIQMITGMLLLLLYCSTQNSISRMIVGMHIPMLVCMEENSNLPPMGQLLRYNCKRILPFYDYTRQKIQYAAVVEDESTFEMLLRLEGTDEDREADMISSEMEAAMLEENEKQKHPGSTEENVASVSGKIIEPAEKSIHYNREELRDFNKFVSEFYTIDATTMVTAEQINMDTLLEKDMTLVTENTKPQILIYHTHASETYADSVAGDLSTTVVAVGEQLAQILRDTYGYQVIHDSSVYDTVRAQAYNVAAPALEQILEENPSIEVIIDLHRDQVQEGTKLLTEVDGVPTAKFMFFNGLSRTREIGDIAYLANPYIADNLAFAFQMQLACNEYYPGLTRKIYVKGYRYNMHYRAKTLLIELGAQTNTLAEAKNACQPVAHALHLVLSGQNRGEE